MLKMQESKKVVTKMLDKNKLAIEAVHIEAEQ
jgi:hypothetical protein